MSHPLQGSQGILRLFRFGGIDVFLHWSWFLVAAWQIDRGRGLYAHIGWSVAEYLGLFAIVLLHEFGHALACRQTGGYAQRIVLWPLGGVAFVQPPFRPGAVLWSIVAGPLVNVLLVPVLFGLRLGATLLPGATPDLLRCLDMIGLINVVILVFNLLPAYPLDGGQILRALLWFGLGPARSLWVAGIVGALVLVLIALWSLLFRNWWMLILSAYLLTHTWGTIRGLRGG